MFCLQSYLSQYKGMKQIYDKQMFDIMSNMTNFLKFESIRAKKGTKVDVDIPDFVTRLNRLTEIILNFQLVNKLIWLSFI
jgi:hypothetical protein